MAKQAVKVESIPKIEVLPPKIETATIIPEPVKVEVVSTKPVKVEIVPTKIPALVTKVEVILEDLPMEIVNSPIKIEEE